MISADERCAADYFSDSRWSVGTTGPLALWSGARGALLGGEPDDDHLQRALNLTLAAYVSRGVLWGVKCSMGLLTSGIQQSCAHDRVFPRAAIEQKLHSIARRRS
jgi:hypothetical protein